MKKKWKYKIYTFFSSVYIFFYYKLSKQGSRIRKKKNCHLDKRCFVIGNGPSLKIEDLNKLKNEITFASNKIYYAFRKTDWRPTYYFVVDPPSLVTDCENIKSVEAGEKYIGLFDNYKIARMYPNDIIKFKMPLNYTKPMKFSKNTSCIVERGYTVLYSCLQFAAYMGIREIYLLGVDCNYPNTSVDGEKYINHFMGIRTDAFIESSVTNNMRNAYEAAKKYADENGIKIFNATRGGKLEVFERIQFDTLFS